MLLTPYVMYSLYRSIDYTFLSTFQAHFRLNQIPLKFVTYLVSTDLDAQLVKYIIQFGKCLFFINNTIFHLFGARNCLNNFS